MASKIQLGAINIATGQYETPTAASKTAEYKCNDCGKRVILRRGEKRIAHFAHYAQTNTCSYYDHPNEAQIHKDAKMLMCKLLNEKQRILFGWCCSYQTPYQVKNKIPFTCMGHYAFEDNVNIFYKDGDQVVTEYRSPDGKWIADVALINNGDVRYIIEIMNTHATTSYRPEPWYEVHALDVIEAVNSFEQEWKENGITNGRYVFQCIRQIERYCYGSFCHKEKWVGRIPKISEESSDKTCILCNNLATQFPTDIGGNPYKVCIECISEETYRKRLPMLYTDRKVQDKKSVDPGPIPNYVHTTEDYKLLVRLPKLISRAGMETQWKQEKACLGCGRSQYSPMYHKGTYYAICKLCMAHEKVKDDLKAKLDKGDIKNEAKFLFVDD